MSKIPGTNVAAPVVPFDTADQYPTHDSKYGKGGWHEVDTFADLANIPQARRTEGMSVYVISEKLIYIYNSGSWETLNDFAEANAYKDQAEAFAADAASSKAAADSSRVLAQTAATEALAAGTAVRRATWAELVTASSAMINGQLGTSLQLSGTHASLTGDLDDNGNPISGGQTPNGGEFRFTTGVGLVRIGGLSGVIAKTAAAEAVSAKDNIVNRIGNMRVNTTDNGIWSHFITDESGRILMKFRKSDSACEVSLTENSLLPTGLISTAVGDLVIEEMDERFGSFYITTESDDVFSHHVMSENGYRLFSIRRQDGRMRLALTEDSLIPPELLEGIVGAPFEEALIAKRQGLVNNRLFFSGDSLFASGSPTVPAAMSAALGGIPYVNSSVGGTGIIVNGGGVGIRQGGIPLLINLSGQLPAGIGIGNSVALSYWSGEITNNQGTQARSGVLEIGDGIPVILRRQGATAVTEGFTLERSVAGSGPITIPDGTRFMPDQAKGNELDMHYIQAGQNDNLSTHANRVLARDNILRMVDRIGHDRFGFVGLKYHSVGQTTGSKFLMNSMLEDALGWHFIKTYEYLGSQEALDDALVLNPALVITSADTAAVASGVMPPVFRPDGIHGSTESNTLEAQYLARWHRGHAWKFGA